MVIAPSPTLEVRGLGKRLTSDLVEARRQGIRDIWDELLVRAPEEDRDLRTTEFWALRGIDFEVRPGEAIGIVGFNGAGKSTLLRLLHGLTLPDAGTIQIRGAHTAILNLGAPFSRVLTGRENIVASAAVHGVSRKAMPELVEAVRAFSELDDDVLSAPMTTYSAGMQLRLGYGIAAQLPSDLILVDEVIAVGDIAFQRKCLAHIRRYLEEGGSVVLVSHDLWMIQALCQRCIVLHKGEIQVEGSTNHAISAYLRGARPTSMHVPRQRTVPDEQEDRQAHTWIEVIDCASTDPDGLIHNGDDLDITLEMASRDGTVRATWRLDILAANRQVCLATIRPGAEDEEVVLGVEPTIVRWRITDLPMLPGTFYLSPHLHDPVTGDEIGRSDAPHPIEIESRHTRFETLVQFPDAGALSSVHTAYRRET